MTSTSVECDLRVHRGTLEENSVGILSVALLSPACFKLIFSMFRFLGLLKVYKMFMWGNVYCVGYTQSLGSNTSLANYLVTIFIILQECLKMGLPTKNSPLEYL